MFDFVLFCFFFVALKHLDVENPRPRLVLVSEAANERPPITIFQQLSG